MEQQSAKQAEVVIMGKRRLATGLSCKNRKSRSDARDPEMDLCAQRSEIETAPCCPQPLVVNHNRALLPR